MFLIDCWSPKPCGIHLYYWSRRTRKYVKNLRKRFGSWWFVYCVENRSRAGVDARQITVHSQNTQFILILWAPPTVQRKILRPPKPLISSGPVVKNRLHVSVIYFHSWVAKIYMISVTYRHTLRKWSNCWVSQEIYPGSLSNLEHIINFAEVSIISISSSVVFGFRQSYLQALAKQHLFCNHTCVKFIFQLICC